MKKLIAVLALATMIGCTTHTEFGPCIGAFDDKDEHTVYKPSTWNIVLGFLFSETIIVPVVVVLDEVQCPIGRK